LRLKSLRFAGLSALKSQLFSKGQFFSKNPGEARLLLPVAPFRKP
jgi:hypothetical protein